MEKFSNKIERIMDANFNRAREGLRVLEDIARFILNDKNISKTIKEMRSSISSIQKKHSDTILFRDTQNDIGTKLNSSQEKIRETLKDVAIANSKRVQESLRVLEEMFKLTDTDTSQEFKSIRYNSYTIEQDILEKLKRVE